MSRSTWLRNDGDRSTRAARSRSVRPASMRLRRRAEPKPSGETCGAAGMWCGYKLALVHPNSTEYSSTVQDAEPGGSMRAAVYETFGAIDVLEVREVPDPSPGPGEVLLEVAAAAINHLDIPQRRGPALLPGFALPHIPGMDVAGTVSAGGPGVDRALVGGRVLVNPALQCGSCAACVAGRDGFCRSEEHTSELQSL